MAGYICEWIYCGAVFETRNEMTDHALRTHLRYYVEAVSVTTDRTEAPRLKPSTSPFNETSHPVSSCHSPMKCKWGDCPFEGWNEPLMHIHVQFKHLLTPVEKENGKILPIPYTGTGIAMPRQSQISKFPTSRGKGFYDIIQEIDTTGRKFERFSCAICGHTVESISGVRLHYRSKHKISMSSSIYRNQNVECGWKGCSLMFVDHIEMNVHVRLKHLTFTQCVPCQCTPTKDSQKHGNTNTNSMSTSSSYSRSSSPLSEPTAFLRTSTPDFNDECTRDYFRSEDFSRDSDVFPDYSLNMYSPTRTDGLDHEPSELSGSFEDSRKRRGSDYFEDDIVSPKRTSSRAEPVPYSRCDIIVRHSKTGFWNKINGEYYCTHSNCNKVLDSCAKINAHYRKEHKSAVKRTKVVLPPQKAIKVPQEAFGEHLWYPFVSMASFGENLVYKPEPQNPPTQVPLETNVDELLEPAVTASSL